MEVIRIDYLNVPKDLLKSSCWLLRWFTYGASSVVRQLYFEGKRIGRSKWIDYI